MSTALAIGGWFAQGFIQTLLDKASNCGIQQLARRRGLHDDLRRLRTSLLRIHAILDKAETRWNHQNTSLVELVRLLKDAAFDAEDLLEEFEYQAVKQKVEHRGDQISDFFSFCLTTASEWLGADGDDAGTRLREIQGKLCDIAADMMDVMQLSAPDDGGRQFDSKMVRRETSSFLTENVVFGRDQEREKVVQLLLDSGSGDGNFSVLPLVGIGGVGKTTLAQLVYNDHRVGNYFHLKVWVCVSDNFDVKRLTKEMIECATKVEQSDKLNLDTLQQILKEKIASERFLLVLDDVWSENRDDWEKLCAPLRFAAQGSKIIVTTRDTKIASIIGTMKEISLDGLEDDAYWELFKKCAFGSRLPESLCNLYNLQALRLWGCHLQSFPQGMNKLINLRQLHVEDKIISKIHEVGKLISLQELSAFKVLKNHGNKLSELGGLTQLHGTLRITNLENVGSQEEASNAKLHSKQYLEALELEWAADQVSSSEHELLVSEEVLLGLQPHHFLKSLTITGYIGATVPSWLDVKMLPNLGTLKLESCRRLEGLSYIGQLPHLKVLRMKRMPVVKQMSRELCGRTKSKLFPRLEELVLEDMPALEEFPNLAQLPCLKIIHMKNMFAVKHIGRELYGDTESNCFLPLEELVLQDMPALEELPNLGQLPHLKVIHMKNVSALKLIGRELCGSREKFWFPRLQVLVLKNMLVLEELPSLGQLPCLKVLRIKVTKVGHGLFSATRNTWFPRLEELKIKGMLTFEELHSLEKLPCLKVFRIEGLPAVKKMGHGICDSTCQREAFPRLEELVLRDMPAWEEWSWAERGELFSCLRRLKIEQCPKLNCLPPIPHSLIKLELWQVGLTGLPGLCKGIDGGSSSTGTASLSLLQIIQCPNLRNLGEGLLSNHLPHINAIRIWACAELLWLPVKRFREFTTLENLSIRNCPKLMSMTQGEENDLLLPPSIKELELCDCGNLGRSLPGCLHNLSSLTQLAILNCPYIISFPREVMLHLKELGNVRIRNCDGLGSIEGLQVLKSLKRLEIIGCPRLLLNERDEQGEFLSLLELSVDKTALLKLSLIKNTLPFIHSLKIILSPQKVMFDREEQELVHSLTALRRLEFLSCKNLQSLPTELHTLPSLRALVVTDCPQIQSLPEKGLPTLLTDLGFDYCHPVLTAQLEKHLAEMNNSGRFHPVYA
ncbi:hypothetical protein B296_00034972 [Ensete ventricosum]|uniref:NB-ARC domain-containing protein n=1 Tax=Ensete ventricosum TaxID=4639 RepID=A0A427A6N7_ENSVE|nr:hypothetical protein B296_00034972 [Ensete ventricosum]